MAAARGRERLSGAVQLPEPDLTINSRPEIRLAKRRPQRLAHSRCSKRIAGAHQHGDGVKHSVREITTVDFEAWR
jgi:hypothetical protein